MKSAIFFLIFLLIPNVVMAYESGTFNLINPTEIEKGKLELIFQHRFRGKVNEEPIESFFGMDYAGTNVGVGFRYVILPKLEINAKRIWEGKEYVTGMAYSYSIPQTPLSACIDIGFFSYEEFILEKSDYERTNGGFGVISLTSKPFSYFSRTTPIVNIGYDTDNKNAGVGIGLAVKILENMGVLQKLNVVWEYYPISKDSEHEKSHAFGFRIETFSHQFDLILSNNSKIGTRNLMAGTIEDKGWRFGFNIKRLLN